MTAWTTVYQPYKGFHSSNSGQMSDGESGPAQLCMHSFLEKLLQKLFHPHGTPKRCAGSCPAMQVQYVKCLQIQTYYIQRVHPYYRSTHVRFAASIC